MAALGLTRKNNIYVNTGQAADLLICYKCNFYTVSCIHSFADFDSVVYAAQQTAQIALL